MRTDDRLSNTGQGADGVRGESRLQKDLLEATGQLAAFPAVLVKESRHSWWELLFSNWFTGPFPPRLSLSLGAIVAHDELPLSGDANASQAEPAAVQLPFISENYTSSNVPSKTTSVSSQTTSVRAHILRSFSRLEALS